MKMIKSKKHAWNYKGIIGSFHCIDCNKSISDYKKRCKSCENKRRIKIGILSQKGRSLSEEIKNKIKLSVRKTTNSIAYRKKRSNIALKLWQNKNYRNKVIRNTFKALQLKPNKPEKIIKLLLPISFKYIGQGKQIIGGYVPDFINRKEMKIIELFGDYWHNLKSYKIRDRKKLKIYKELGYKVLVIWEHELKNIKNLKIKIKNFLIQ